MSDALTAYWTASRHKQTVLEKAAEAADQLAKAAAVLSRPPADWRFWTENDGFRNCDPADAAGSIDYTDWPSIGYLVSLHLQSLDADRRLIAAYGELTAQEQLDVSNRD